jgi:hypothetical protein
LCVADAAPLLAFIVAFALPFPLAAAHQKLLLADETGRRGPVAVEAVVCVRFS